MFNLNNFKSNFRNGGLRSDLFQVVLTNPVNGISDLTSPFLIKATTVPSYTINPIEVFYFGRATKFAGRKTYEDWSTTLYNDEDLTLRNALEEWSNAINSPETNTRKLPSSDSSLYKSDAIVNLMSQKGDVIRTYKMVGLFPTSIQSIDLDWESENVVQTQVSWTYDYFIVEPGVTGNAGGI